MENVSTADILALTRGNGNDFLGGSVGLVLGIIIVFILLFRQNGTQYNDVVNALYSQTQDNANRGLAQGQCSITEQVMSSNYDNALILKDMSNQISNSIAGLSNQISNQTNAIQGMFAENTIRELSDQITVLRGQNSNLMQTATLTNAINNQTQTILGNLGQWHAYPPCYSNGCGCSNLY